MWIPGDILNCKMRGWILKIKIMKRKHLMHQYWHKLHFLDEFAARSYIVAHQHGEDVVGFSGVFNVYLLQHAGFRIHGGFPQLLRIHFTQTFVSLGVDTIFGAVAVLLHEGLAFFIGITVFADFAF